MKSTAYGWMRGRRLGSAGSTAAAQQHGNTKILTKVLALLLLLFINYLIN